MFLIASGDLPKIKHRGLASKRCLSFVAACTSGEDDRPQAKDLLLHPFLGLACEPAVMSQLLTRTYELEANANEEEEEEEKEDGQTDYNGQTIVSLESTPEAEETKEEPVPPVPSVIPVRAATVDSSSSDSKPSNPPTDHDRPSSNKTTASRETGILKDEASIDDFEESVVAVATKVVRPTMDRTYSANHPSA